MESKKNTNNLYTKQNRKRFTDIENKLITVTKTEREWEGRREKLGVWD